jgi:hypothetical protein
MKHDFKLPLELWNTFCRRTKNDSKLGIHLKVEENQENDLELVKFRDAKVTIILTDVEKKTNSLELRGEIKDIKFKRSASGSYTDVIFESPYEMTDEASVLPLKFKDVLMTLVEIEPEIDIVDKTEDPFE